MLLRKSFFIPSYNCVMCNSGTMETRDHLFFHCPFAQHCWTYICPDWTPNHMDIQEELDALKQLLQVPFAMDIIILVSWAIWTTRNDYIFKAKPPNLYTCRRKLKEELKWIIYRVKRKDYEGFADWVRTFR